MQLLETGIYWRPRPSSSSRLSWLYRSRTSINLYPLAANIMFITIDPYFSLPSSTPVQPAVRIIVGRACNTVSTLTSINRCNISERDRTKTPERSEEQNETPLITLRQVISLSTAPLTDLIQTYSFTCLVCIYIRRGAHPSTNAARHQLEYEDEFTL